MSNKYGVKKGDVFVFAFGSDCTVREYFQVLETNGEEFITVQEIEALKVSGNNWNWKQKPNKDQFLKDSKPMRKKVNITGFKDDEPFIRIKSYGWCRLLRNINKPQDCDNYA